MDISISPRFFCDGMLGSLARWLRMAGFDTTYERDLDDEDILKMIVSTKRILLTRDRDLAERCNGAILITSLESMEQLEQVLSIHPPNRKIFMTRCTNCNGLLENVEKGTVTDNVPEGVLKVQEKFWSCKDCGQVYWKGSHYSKIIDTIERCSKV